jgi:hypothetical protein
MEQMHAHGDTRTSIHAHIRHTYTRHTHTLARARSLSQLETHTQWQHSCIYACMLACQHDISSEEKKKKVKVPSCHGLQHLVCVHVSRQARNSYMDSALKAPLHHTHAHTHTHTHARTHTRTRTHAHTHNTRARTHTLSHAHARTWGVPFRPHCTTKLSA